MAEITDDNVVALLPVLAEAARANDSAAARFIPPRTGILEEAAAARHQFVFGRRGVGKSTLLRRIASRASGSSVPAVLFIDIETLGGRPYPDVLIELLRMLMADLAGRLSGPRLGWLQRSRRRAQKDVREVQSILGDLLSQPQVAMSTIRRLDSSKRSQQASGSLEIAAKAGVAGMTGSGGASVSRRGERTSAEERVSVAEFEETKMQGLLEIVLVLQRALTAAHAQLANGPTLIVLDDFYHIRSSDQPDVLAYLHQVLKNLPFFLKICSVRHRLNPFTDEDPPRGMQIGHDASPISLDIGLDRFEAASLFLGRVLKGLCDPLAIDTDDLLTPGGRDRLVLGSGGVARDFISLTSMALRAANERSSSASRPHNRITAEDVNVAAAQLANEKQNDLVRDAGTRAEELSARLSEVVEFALDGNKTNVFLVESTKLQQETWGKDLLVLADLRLLHHIGTLAVKAGGSYRGRKFTAFTLDLSHWTSTRSEQIRQIPFWTTAGKQDIRSPSLIYTPERAADVRAQRLASPPRAAPSAATAVSESAEPEELEFEFLPPPPE